MVLLTDGSSGRTTKSCFGQRVGTGQCFRLGSMAAREGLATKHLINAAVTGTMISARKARRLFARMSDFFDQFVQ
jgi:hypothetical protein